MGKTLNLSDEEADRLLADLGHLVDTSDPDHENTDLRKSIKRKLEAQYGGRLGR